jgi:hypothetical protein
MDALTVPEIKAQLRAYVSTLGPPNLIIASAAVDRFSLDWPFPGAYMYMYLKWWARSRYGLAPGAGRKAEDDYKSSKYHSNSHPSPHLFFKPRW